MLPLSTLLRSGFTPTLKDFNNFLLFISRNQRFQTVIHLFSQLSSNKIIPDAQTHSIFARALLKQHKYEQTAEFLKALDGKSVIFNKNRVIDSLIQGICTNNQDPERGLSFLKDFLKTRTFLPSSHTFSSLIGSFCKMGKMDNVIDLLELMSDDKLKYPFDNYVCSSVISGFLRIGEPDLAVRFYETAAKSGSFRPNTVTCASLLTAYCRLRDVNRVSHLVSWMESNELVLDVVFYSNWICGCLSEGLIYEAFRKYRAMVDTNVELDNISYTILIDGFSKNGYVEKCVGFLHKMRKKGVVPNIVTYTAIILGFCEKGKLDEAFAVFSMVNQLGIECDEFVYAVLIRGVCRKGDFDLAFNLLDEMCKKGINPGVITYNTVVNGLCKAGRTSEASDFSKGVVGDVITYTTLLQGYIQERNEMGILETKARLEAETVDMDVVMCNVLIKAMLMVGLFEDARAVYKGMRQMNLSANSVTYHTLIDGYCKAGRIHEALEIFNEFESTSNYPVSCYKMLDRTVCLMLIDETFKNKGIEGVLKLIKKMEDTGLLELQLVCNDIVSFLCRMHFPEASYHVFIAMRSKGSASASIGYYSIVRALLFEGKRLLAQRILTCFIKACGMSDFRVCEIVLLYLCLNNVKNALIFLSKMNEKRCSVALPFSIFKTLIKEDRISDAYELLVGAENSLHYMNVVEYSIIIDSLCKARYIDKALRVCDIAKKKGVALNIVTYNSVINGLCREGCLVEAFRLFDSLERINILPTEVTYGTLIDALVQEGVLEDARILFERMLLKNLVPSTRIYNSLINGFSKSNLLEEAIRVYGELESRGLKPDGFTVSALINGYCQKGDMEGALKLFFDFKSTGLLPDFLGFLYLLRGLCAKGRMEESRGVLREMLRTQSVLDMLGRVDSDVESDSVENLLVFLCEQGRILDAVALLDEVGLLIFPVKGSSSRMKVDTRNDFCSQSSDVEDGEVQQFNDFDSFYSHIRALCYKGEMSKANKLTRLVTKL